MKVSERKKERKKVGKRDIVPLLLIKVNSCAPACVLCGLYSSVKTHRFNSARWMTLELSLNIQVGERI